MDQAYWDRIADRFDDEVLKIRDRDLNGTLEGVIKGLASPSKTVSDFGCGNGSLLPSLSKFFGEVVAIDHSAKLLEHARSCMSATQNIRYVQADLSQPYRTPRKTDVLICVNVLLHPDHDIREKILENATSSIKQHGAIVLVVPAFESLLHTYATIVECNLAMGISRDQALREVQSVYDEEVVSTVDGIVTLGTEPTKMHTLEATRSMLADQGLRRIDTHRIEYDWEEMIDDAPTGLGEPYPWDWLFVARKA